MKSSAEISEWLVGQIAGILSLPEDDIDPDATFDSFGLASRDAVSLSGDLEDYLDRRLSPTLLYQYPTVRELADHLAKGEPGARKAPAIPEKPAAPRVERTAELSEEEVEAALLKKLLELGE